MACVVLTSKRAGRALPGSRHSDAAGYSNAGNARCAADIDIYIGNDAEILPTLALGGKGVISTMGNIAPGDISNIVEKFMAGDLEGSRKLQLGILPIIRLLFADVNPMPVKAALRMMGFDMGQCRLPLVDIEEELRAALQQEMKRYSLI